MGQFQRMFKLWRSGRGFSAGGNFQIDHGGRCAGITQEFCNATLFGDCILSVFGFSHYYFLISNYVFLLLSFMGNN